VAEPALSWKRRNTWASLLPVDGLGAGAAEGVSVAPCERLGLATVIACRGRADELRARIATLYGFDAPSRPIIAHGRGLDLMWAGPEQWLARSTDRAMAARLVDELRGLAAVSDQSDGRAILRIAGPRARETLAKGCPIDLHPRAFRRDDAALTVIAHIGVQLWQVDETPTYELLVAASMAGSFWRWLSASARPG